MAGKIFINYRAAMILGLRKRFCPALEPAFPHSSCSWMWTTSSPGSTSYVS